VYKLEQCAAAKCAITKKRKTKEDHEMKGLKVLALVAFAIVCFTTITPKIQAQVGVEIGVAPVCPYGYYDVPPYNCAPYGYYGPEWFAGGVFIGTGPWFHGPEGFHGHVNNHYHPEHGYHGPLPARGDRPEPGKRLDKVAHFKGNEVRDGHGHVVGKR
jgi:hypothetical protein